MNTESTAIWKNLKMLIAFLGPHKKWLLIVVLMALVCTITEMVFSLLVIKIVNSAIDQSIELIIRYALIVSATLFIDIPANIIKVYSVGKYAEFGLFNIRQKTAMHITKLPISRMDKYKSGDLISRITNDLNIVEELLKRSLSSLLSLPLLFVASLIFLFVLSWKLTLFSITITPILIFMTMIISKPIGKYTEEQQEEIAKVNSTAQDAILGLTVVKSFNLQDIIKERFGKQVDHSVLKSLKLAFTEATITPISFFMQMIPFILTFAYGGYLVLNNEMTLGSLLAFISLMNNATSPIQEFPILIRTLRAATAASSRIFQIWGETSEAEGGESHVKANEQAISLKNVYFSYNGEDDVLNDISFDVKEGETVAFVGPSGCGKSTLIKLIAGFYPLREGSISIYQREIKNWNLNDMRQLISLVSQDTYLFPESIYSNIAYGNLNASEDDIIEASKVADMHDTIEYMQEGYNTIVGERGARLSGGQRQRISIARAVLKNAPILLLDEATSALDSKSEKQVQNSLEKLMMRRTTLIIAHRLSTIKNADRIIVMNHGKIIESGIHDELIKKSVLYKELYSKQFIEENENEFRALELAGEMNG